MTKTVGFKPNFGCQGLEGKTALYDGTLKFDNALNWTGVNFEEGYGRSLQKFKRVGGILFGGALAQEGFEDFMLLKLANREGLKEAVSEDGEKYEN